MLKGSVTVEFRGGDGGVEGVLMWRGMCGF